MKSTLLLVRESAVRETLELKGLLSVLLGEKAFQVKYILRLRQQLWEWVQMTGFVHAGETDGRTAGPDFISAVKTDGQGEINTTEREKKHIEGKK